MIFMASDEKEEGLYINWDPKLKAKVTLVWHDSYIENGKKHPGKIMLCIE